MKCGLRSVQGGDAGLETLPGSADDFRVQVYVRRAGPIGNRRRWPRWYWSGVMGAFLVAGVGDLTAARAGALNIDSVVLDSAHGDTFASACQNTKGYFAELGTRSPEARLVLDIDLRGELLRNLLGRGVPEGWSIEYGKALPESLRVDWSGRASWVDALAEVSRRDNLVIVIAWAQKSVYVDKL